MSVSGSQSAGSPQRAISLSRSGWLEKYSVGRGILPVKNWQKRFVTVTHKGLNYSKSPDQSADARTYIPFTASEAYHEVKMNPVFLLPVVTAALHPEASDSHYCYFGIRFEEKGTPRILLLRTQVPGEREQWVKFIGQYIHVGSVHGVPAQHPLDSCSPRLFDPEELDANEKRALRRAVMDWDEGCDLRAVGPAPSPDDSLTPESELPAMSASPVGGAGETPPKAVTPSASAVQTPRGGLMHAPTTGAGEVDREDEDLRLLSGGGDTGVDGRKDSQAARSGVQPSVRSRGALANTAGSATGRSGLRAVSPTRPEDVL